MYAFLFAAIVGLAAASPRPQDVDFGSVADSLPSPTLLGPAISAISDAVSYASTAVLSSIFSAASAEATNNSDDSYRRKRDTATTTCQAQPSGYGPVTSPDTVSAFLNNRAIFSSASAAASAAPAAYSNAFTNLQGSTQQTGYLGLHTLQSYDVAKCASYCDSSAYCEAFNIYFERDPTVNPNDPGCSNPQSLTNIKCTLYGYPLSANTATNTGQYRNKFQVVIAGSNGYVKHWQAPALTNFTGPVTLPAAINAPFDPVTGKNTYLPRKSYDTGRFDPSLCAAACQAQTLYDKAHTNGTTTYDPCNFFNAYILVKDGVPQGTVCSMYSEPWNSSYATNYGQTGSDGSVYTIAESFSYTLGTQDPGSL